MRVGFGSEDLWLFESGPQELLDIFDRMLQRDRKKIVRGKEFVYASGNIPIMLAAHVDSVHNNPPTAIYLDEKAGVMWSPDGLGADDRAGVLGILEMLRRGYKPHVMLLDGEESGCTGAREAVRVIRDPGVLYIVELDRKNGGEAVFYDCGNSAFKDYITSFGFREDVGTFSDITTLCPAWNVAGVNLSCGYYNAHTAAEYLRLPELWSTLEKLERMLRCPPKRRFRYMHCGKVIRHATHHSPYRGWWEDASYSYSHVRNSGSVYSSSIGDLLECLPEDLSYTYGNTPGYWEWWLEERRTDVADAAYKGVIVYVEREIEKTYGGVTANACEQGDTRNRA